MLLSEGALDLIFTLPSLIGCVAVADHFLSKLELLYECEGGKTTQDSNSRTVKGESHIPEF